MAERAAVQQIVQVTPSCPRRAQEVGEACVARAHNTPDDAQRERRTEQVTSRYTHVERILAQPGDRESTHENPMRDAYERIPDLDPVRSGLFPRTGPELRIEDHHTPLLSRCLTQLCAA